jgi:hypothetical protein
MQSCAAWSNEAPEAASDVVVVQHVSLLARVALTSPGVLLLLLPLTAQGLMDVGALADLMLALFDQVGSAGGLWRRKLWAMALLSLFSGSVGGAAAVGAMLPRLDQVLNVALDVLAEMEMEQPGGHMHLLDMGMGAGHHTRADQPHHSTHCYMLADEALDQVGRRVGGRGHACASVVTFACLFGMHATHAGCGGGGSGRERGR